MRFWLVFLTIWLTNPLQAAAQDWAGNWVWWLEDKPAMVLALDASGRGHMLRPSQLTMDANAGYWRMIDASAEVSTMTVTPTQITADELTLQTVDAQSGETTAYRLVRTGPDQGELLLANIGAAPAFPLTRSLETIKVADDWVPGRAYGRRPVVPDNTDLAAFFAADQAARQAGTVITADTAERDAERRLVVRRMLDEGQVRSGADYYHAAFIFQHGNQPNDYLLAHALAVAAVARGRDDASWIAAATLDRYLQAIGQSQIYGTQFQIPNDGSGTTQGAYDRSLLPDSVRRDTGVPPLAAQAEQLRIYDRTD